MGIFVKYLLPIGLSFILGITLFSIFHSLFLSLLVTLVTLSFLAALFSSGSRQLMLYLLVIFTCLAFWAGSLHTEKRLSTPETDLNRTLEGEVVRVISEGKISGTFSRYTVKLDDETKALLTTHIYPRFSYGTKLKIDGELKEAPIFEDFNYRAYLQKEGIDAIIYLPNVEIKEEGGRSFTKTLLLFKDILRSSLHSSIPYPNNTIAGAMILGDGDRVPEKIGSLFSSTGIRHIIAISGMHVTIIAGMLLVLFSSFFRFGRNPSFYIVSFFIVLFVLFVGAPASATRAGIMAIIFLFAFKMGKIYDAPRALFVAALLMLAFNPLLLFHDVGFQLSFLAVFGILYLTPHFEKLMGRDRSFMESRETTFSLKDSLISLLSVSLGAHLATLPVVAYNFEIVSFSAPITNLIAVPLLPVVIISGFCASLLGALSIALGSLAGIPAFLSLEIILRGARFLDAIPGSSVEVKISALWVSVSYLTLISTAVFLNFRGSFFKPTTLSPDSSPPPESKPF